jgi:hypothetical protein
LQKFNKKEQKKKKNKGIHFISKINKQHGYQKQLWTSGQNKCLTMKEVMSRYQKDLCQRIEL